MKLRTGTGQEAGMSPGRLELIRRRGREWVEKGITPALVVLAARHGIIVLHDAFGKLTPEDDSPPLRVDSLFPLQSITKVFTATAVMILVDDGLVGLNRPVCEYIPEFAGDGRESVMVHHLLTHTTGISNEDLIATEEREGDLELPTPGQNADPYVAELVRRACLTPLRWQPGERQEYSGRGITMAGEIVRRVSSLRIDSFCKERIFEPLGMKNTCFCPPEAVWNRIVRRPPGLEDDVDGPAELNSPLGASGAYSTALDMAIFGQMFLNGGSYGTARVLSRAATREMTRNQIPGVSATLFTEFFPEAYWGYGWSVHGNKRSLAGAMHSPEAFEFWGAGGVYLWVDPVYQVVGVCFSVSLEPKGGPGTMTNAMRWWVNDLFTDVVTASVADL